MESREPVVGLEPRPGRWHTPTKGNPVGRRLYSAGLVLSGACALLGFVPGLPALSFTALMSTLVLVNGAYLSKQVQQAPLFSDGANEFRLENPDDLDVCLVALYVVNHGQPDRWDQGAAWFEDGRLFFSGLHTSFVIGGEDVLPRDEWKVFGSDEQYSLLPESGVPLRAADRSYVSFIPITRIEGGRSFERELRFKRRLTQFRNDPPASRGPRQLPPLTL